MPPITFWSAAEKFGFPAVCLAVVAIFLGWLIKYIVKDASCRERKLHELITNHLTSYANTMNIITERLNEFRKNNEEAHKYQREEHQAMIGSLIKLNGKVSK